VPSVTALFNNNRYSGPWGQLAIFAAVLAIVFVTGNLPWDATASHNDSNYTAVR
jgi:hypothetical protein